MTSSYCDGAARGGGGGGGSTGSAFNFAFNNARKSAAPVPSSGTSSQTLTARSKVNKPTFRGAVSEAGPVTVHVHEGPAASGKEVTSFKVSASEAGEWSVVASPALADGTRLRSEYVLDTLHLNPAGYAALNRLVEPVLAGLLRSHDRSSTQPK